MSVTPWTTAHQASLSFIISPRLFKLTSIESVMIFNHLTLCHPFLPLPSISPSIRVASNELILPIRWSEYWSVSFSLSPCNEYSRLISFRLTGLIPLLSKGLSRVSSISTIQNHQLIFLVLSFLYGPTLTSTHDYWKTHSFDYTDIIWLYLTIILSEKLCICFLICCPGLS